MNLQFKFYRLWIMIIPFMFMACNKDEMQAEDSIKGEWNIIEINSHYGEFFQNGFNPSETISEIDQLGTFIFMEDSVQFDFTRNDTLYTGIDSWDIISEKVNSGFTKETKFMLTIENHFIFNVAFEDGTRNSEKDAKKVTFINIPSNGQGVLIEMLLEKS